MQLTQALNRAVQIRSKRTATIYRDRLRTWGDVGTRVPKFASALRALGLQRGDRVAVLALNSDRYLELFFATAWAGLVLVPLNTRWAVPENLYALREAECPVLLVDDQFLEQASALRSGCELRHVIYMGEHSPQARQLSYERLLDAAEPMPDECGIGDDLCGIYYTGGTTGRPKGVMLSHTNCVSASINWIASLHFSEDTVYLHSAGFFHLAGASPAMALTMMGGVHVCLPKFDAVLAFEAIQKHRINYVLFVPTMVNLLINHPDFEKYDLTSVRYCEYGASPMPNAVLNLALEKLPTWEFIQGYGMTETSALNLSLPWRYHFDSEECPSKRTATGRAALGVDIRIVDPHGKELPRGTVGEIAVRGPQVMLGYWKNPEATNAAIRNRWMHTGDGAFMDDDGFVHIVDRVKDMIISGGENVYSREVENAIYQHPAVLDCAVIAIPDTKWGESVHAVVVFREGKSATMSEIVEHCRTLIAGYKCPRSVEFRESLPISAAGKLQKNLLREPYWREQSLSVG